MPQEEGVFPVKGDLNSRECQIPGCDANIVSSCKCFRSDSKCAKGHEFHFSFADGRMGVTVVHAGGSDHASTKCCSLAH